MFTKKKGIRFEIIIMKVSLWRVGGADTIAIP
jgi:hypothetical protein